EEAQQDWQAGAHAGSGAKAQRGADLGLASRTTATAQGNNHAWVSTRSNRPFRVVRNRLRLASGRGRGRRRNGDGDDGNAGDYGRAPTAGSVSGNMEGRRATVSLAFRSPGRQRTRAGAKSACARRVRRGSGL